MSATAIPTMIVDDVELRSRPGVVAFAADPMECDHYWEPHAWETGRAYCPRCGSLSRWLNDPRASAEATS